MSLYLILHNLALVLTGAAIVYQLHRLKQRILMAQNTIDQVVAQLTKVEGEVVATRDALLAEIKDLKDQIANGVTPTELDLSGLLDVAERLDQLTPDPADDDAVDPDFGVNHPE